MSKTKVFEFLKLLALCVFVVTLPFGNKFLFLCNNLSIFLFGGVWLVESSVTYKLKALKNNRVVLWYPIYFLLYLAGLLYSENLKEGLFIIEKKLPLLLLPLFLVSMRPLAIKQLRALSYGYVVACFSAGVACVWVAIAKNLEEGHTPSYIYNAVVHDIHLPGRYLYFNYWYFTNKLFAQTVSMHPVYLAMNFLVAAVFVLKLEWPQAAGWRRIGLYLLLSFFILLIVLLSSRTQLFCTVLVILAVMVRYVYRSRQYVKALVALALFFLGAAAIVMFNPVIRERIWQSNVPGEHYSANKYGEGGLSLRTYKWKYSLETIQSNLFFGTGTGDGQVELEKTYALHDFAIGLENHFNPHNQYLQSALDLGVIALVALLMLLGGLWRMAYRTKNEMMFVIVTVIAISFVSESMLELNKGVVFFAFMPLFSSLAFQQRVSGRT